jgi:uncharacterized protein
VRVAVLAASLLLGAGAAEAQPSFRCTPDLVGAEFVICDTPALHALDRRLAELYRAALARAGANAASLRAEQRAFLASRDACTAITSRERAGIAGCIGDAMRERIRELSPR